MKKIVVFYSKTGSGHLRAAQALKEEIEAQRKDTAVILHEGLETAGFGIKVNPSLTYSLLSQELLWLFNFIYFITNNRNGVKFLRFLIKGIWGKSISEVIEREKPDLIITTHHHISPSTIYKYNLKIPFIAIVTDLGYPHIIWFDKNASHIITPTKEMSGYAKKIVGEKQGQVVHIDYPLKNHFAPVKKTGFSDTILVLGGGSGSGNILSRVRILAQHFPDKKIIVVCGNNKKLFNHLKWVASPNLDVHGFVDHMATLYNKADIVISKAGPGTIVEAATLRKPLIITSWVGLQEKDNVTFVLENNLGVYEPKAEKLPQAVEKIYRSYSDYIRGQDLFKNGTQKIVRYILNTKL